MGGDHPPGPGRRINTKALTASAIAWLVATTARGRQYRFRAGRGQGEGDRNRRSNPRRRLRLPDPLITLSVAMQEHEALGTLRHGSSLWKASPSACINGIEVDALVAPVMIYVSNEDKAGFHRPFQKHSALPRSISRHSASAAIARARPRSRSSSGWPCPGKGARRNRDAAWRQGSQSAGVLTSTALRLSRHMLLTRIRPGT